MNTNAIEHIMPDGTAQYFRPEHAGEYTHIVIGQYNNVRELELLTSEARKEGDRARFDWWKTIVESGEGAKLVHDPDGEFTVSKFLVDASNGAISGYANADDFVMKQQQKYIENYGGEECGPWKILCAYTSKKSAERDMAVWNIQHVNVQVQAIKN